MTSQERVQRALSADPPDRVPVVEFVVDPKVAFALVPDATDVPDACDQLGLDSVSSSAMFRTVEDGGDEYVDEWGVSYRRGAQVVSHPVSGPIKDGKDLDKWEPPDPDDPIRTEHLQSLVRRYKGKRSIFYHHRAAFMWSAYLTGLDRLLSLFYEDPEFVHELFRRVTAVNERIIRNAIRAGAEIICLGDDYASNTGPMFSPAMFREFILPHLKRVIDAIHEDRKSVV